MPGGKSEAGETYDRPPSRPLYGSRAHRPRRHGRDLPRDRHGARPLVAVKLLDRRYAQDEAVRQRFTREALAVARLSGNPHIVTIYDVGEWGSRPYIVMEYLPAARSRT